jgi:hypothetical protein
MKTINDLEKKITVAMSGIKKGTTTPAESKIGTLFMRLKPLDEALYEKLMNEYKPVFANWKKANPGE